MFALTNPHGSVSVPITAERFHQIDEGRRALLLVLALEEQFNALLENYCEFERECLEQTLRHVVFAPTENGWSEFQDNIYTMNRRLLNFLASCRLYLDNIPQTLGDIFPVDSSVVGAAKALAATEFDGHLAYRAMDAIRNHAQHQTIPVTHVAFGGEAVRDSVSGGVRNTVTARVLISDLQVNTRLRRATVDELTAIAEDGKIEIIPLVRGYVECVGRIHGGIQKLMKSAVTSWDEAIESAYAEAMTAGVGKFVEAREFDHEDIVARSFNVYLELIKRRRHLERRTTHAASIARHYVSGVAGSIPINGVNSVSSR